MALRDRGDAGEIVGRASLRPGERPNRLSSRYLRQKFLALGPRSGLLDGPAREHDRFQKWLDHEIAAELLHDDHARQRARAKTAKIFRERRRQQPKLGEGSPMPSAPAFFGRDDLAARVDIILVTEQALNAIAQELLVLCKLNIHLAPRASRLQTKHCFCDDVALDLVRSAVNAKLARVEILFRRGMPVVWPRHEHIIARRMLAKRKAVVADRAMREVGDALEDFGAPDLEK